MDYCWRQSSHEEDILSTQVSKMITKMIRHHDQGEREQDGSYHWDIVRSVLLKAFAQNGAGDFSDNQWIHLSREGSSEKRVEYCLDNKKSLCYLRAIQTHSDGIPIRPGMMGYTFIPCDWKVHIFHGIFTGCSIYFGEWTNSGRKGKRQIPTSSLFHTSESVC